MAVGNFVMFGYIRHKQFEVNMKISITDRGIHAIGHLLSAGGFQSRLVGGAVRDMVVGMQPKDMDLATDALPEVVMELAERKGYRVIPTGLQHGTVTLMYEDVGYEVTTLRKDVETDGRHATVEYVTDFAEDAARRDFTFNAMSASLDGQVHDYFGGLKDLNEGRVRFVGNARERIEEDYLRILRFFRFRARFGGEETEHDLQAIKDTAHGLSGISVERVWSEISKVLQHSNGTKQLRPMASLGVAQVIGLPIDEEHIGIASDAREFGARPSVMLGILSGHESYAEELGTRWKLSNAELKDAVAAAQVLAAAECDPHYWLTQAVNGLDPAVACPILSALGAHAAAKALAGDIPVFPLKGRDLVGVVDKGPGMGAALNEAKVKWIDSGFTLSKEELITEIMNGGPAARRL